MLKKIGLALSLALSAGLNTVTEAQTNVAVEAAKVAVTVRVTRPDGSPATGAVVRITSSDDKTQVLTADIEGTVATQMDVPRSKSRYLGRAVVYEPNYGLNGAAIKAGDNNISLLPVSERRGRIVDGKGAPVAGVTLVSQVAVLPNQWYSMIWLTGSDETPVFTVKSDAEGRFLVPGMPRGYTVRLRIQDPRYVSATVELLENSENTFKVQPAATVQGRLVDEAGDGIPNARVMAQPVEYRVEGSAANRTDAQGKYTLTGLPTGKFNIMVDFGEKAKLIAVAEPVNAVAGKTITAPLLKAVPGVLVSGIARDKVTKVPLAKVGVGLHGPHRPRNGSAVTSAFTDETGRYQIRAIPGGNYFYIYSAPEGYLSPGQMGRDVQVSDKPAPVDFDFEPAPRVKGIVVDELGKPVTTTLLIGANWENRSFTSGDDGQFETAVPQEGPVSFSGVKIDGKFWEVVSPKRVVPPFKTPIRIVVRPGVMRSLRGRVITPTGEAIPDAKIVVSVYVPQGDRGGLSMPSNLQSDTQGNFTMDEILPNFTLTLRASREGYNLVRGGGVKLNGAIWQAEDFVMEPLSAAVEGRVLSMEGKPLADAQILANGQETVSAVDGGFKLTGLPAHPILVLARQGQNLAVARSKDGQVELKPAPVTLQKQDLKLAAEIYDELMFEVQNKPRNRDNWFLNRRALLGNNFDQHFEALASRPAGTGDGALFQLASFIQNDTSMNGTQKTTRLHAILGAMTQPEMRFSLLAKTVAESKDLAIRAEFWPDTKAVAAELDGKTLSEDKLWWRQAALWAYAVAAERQDGFEAGRKVLDTAIAFVLKKFPEKPEVGDDSGDTTRDNYLQMAVPTIAQGSPALLRHLLDQIDPESGYYVQALAGAIPVTVQHHGYEAAKPLLDELEKLPMPKTGKPETYVQRQPAYAFGQSIRKIVPIVGRTSPPDALALAQRIKTDAAARYSWENARPWALAAAAVYLPIAEAAPIWREVFPELGVQTASRYASLAYARDEALGRELFGLVRAELPDTDKMHLYEKYRDIAAFAYYLAPVEPAESRMLLEKTWVQAEKAKDTEGMSQVSRAMTRLDARRALELAKSIPENEMASSTLARQKIARWVAADETVRSSWPFDRAGAMDFWQEGSDEW